MQLTILNLSRTKVFTKPIFHLETQAYSSRALLVSWSTTAHWDQSEVLYLEIGTGGGGRKQTTHTLVCG